jgi:hypothetical protein
MQEARYMNCKLSWLPAIMVFTCASLFAQTPSSQQTPAHVLHNHDVLLLLEQGVKSGEVIAKIIMSPCMFDTFPPVLQDLEARGVPHAVVMAMKMVPYGPSAIKPFEPAKKIVPPATSVVQIPEGTLVAVEAVKTVSSADIQKGNAIPFVVTRRVFVNGVLAIDHGAAVTGQVIKSSPAGFWGRGGTLEFALEDVLAVDGTRIPIKLAKTDVKGGNHKTAVTTAAIVTSAVTFPYVSPIGLIWALQKGENAVLDKGTRVTATVRQNQQVAGFLPEKRQPIYHPVDTINQQNRPVTSGLAVSI